MENLLEIRNVSKKYPKFTLNDISFSIPKGSIVGFIGRNGAGKSTALKGIMNLVHFDSGEVIAFNKSMKENELYAKQEIGFSLSEVNYYPNKTIKQIVDVIKKFYVNFKQEKFVLSSTVRLKYIIWRTIITISLEKVPTDLYTKNNVSLTA